MKTNLTGLDAYYKILDCALPEKTETYTPIAHPDVFDHLRREIRAAGCIIIGEDYKCTADRTYKGEETPGGQIAVGLMKIKYGADPDLVLSAAFLNSYNKQYAFRFALGAHVQASGVSLMLENNFRRIHTGAADVFATGTITDIIRGVSEYWEQLTARKNCLKEYELTTTGMVVYALIGKLFFEEDLLTTPQLNIVKKELARLRESGHATITGWQLYNLVAEGIKDAHPAEWLDVHVRVAECFNQLFELDKPVTPTAPASLPGAAEVVPVKERDADEYDRYLVVGDQTETVFYDGPNYHEAEDAFNDFTVAEDVYFYGQMNGESEATVLDARSYEVEPEGGDADWNDGDVEDEVA